MLQIEENTVQDRPRRRLRSLLDEPKPLPTWPIAAMFGPYIVWWALGIGEGIWAIMSLPMLAYLAARRERVKVPRGFGLWLLFLAWMCISVVQIDTFGRLLGFMVRVAIYIGATVAFVYVYNSDRRVLTIERVARMMTVFWIFVVVGGFLALAFPHGVLHTPMSYLIPNSIASNDLVQQIIHPRFTQGNAGGYFDMALRPAAPFPFTNAWGTNFTLTLPFVFITLSKMRRGPLFWALVGMIPLGLIPAFYTQNRGMLLAAAIGIAYVAMREITRGRVAGIIGITLFLGAAVAMTAVVPVGQMIAERTSTGDTNATRLAVYGEAISRTKESPLIGYGAPRPSMIMGAPSAGTQGQFWMVLFSQGFVGVALFMSWFISLTIRSARAPTSEYLWVHTVLLMMTLECFYYGMMGSAIVITMVAGSLALRDKDALTPVRGRAFRLEKERAVARAEARATAAKIQAKTRAKDGAMNGTAGAVVPGARRSARPTLP